MNHFQTHTGGLAKQQQPQSSFSAKPASEAAPTSLSQAELRDIVLAILG